MEASAETLGGLVDLTLVPYDMPARVEQSDV